MSNRFLMFLNYPIKKRYEKLPHFLKWRLWLKNAIVNEAQMRVDLKNSFQKVLKNRGSKANVEYLEKMRSRYFYPKKCAHPVFRFSGVPAITPVSNFGRWPGSIEIVAAGSDRRVGRAAAGWRAA